jgi:hypothetical protein
VQGRGDWRKGHGRAPSRCFFCNPGRRESYAAKYRAEYGKEPPPVPELDEKKEKDKKGAK